MTFLYPAALLLILPFLAWGFYRPFRSRTLNIIRTVLSVVFVLALAGPQLRLPDRSGMIVAVIDRSRSMPPNAKADSEEFLKRLSSLRTADSRLGIVSFGGEAAIEKLPGTHAFDGLKAWIENPDASNLTAGLDAALNLIPENTPGRIMLITDSNWTGSNPARLFAASAARKIPVDFRLIRRQTVHDLAIAAVDAPQTAAPGESCTITLRIHSPEPQEAVCRIQKNGGAGKTLAVSLKRGFNFITWRDRSDTPGIADYNIEITGKHAALDEIPENNRAHLLIQITGRKSVLLLTESPSGNLAKALKKANLPIVVRRPSPQELTPAKLAGYSGVILENVPAERLGPDGMALLAGMVKSGSLGLMMTGGRNSFAVGGYYRSPIEEILPVSLEQRQEVRKSSLALIVALDRSGSMAMPVGNRTKIDLANQATLEVFRLMAPQDEFGVIAVDSSPHKVIHLSPVSGIRQAERRIRSIESMGGGIFTYTALHAATADLLKSNAVTRHLLLFADAADAEEPGNYKELLEQTSRAGITVSVVGLGTEADPDAEFLKDIARRGNGICYFSDRADELPRIFAQDTFVIARSTFIDAPTTADYTASVRSLAVTRLGKSTEFGGYNLCYRKDGTETLLVSRDEFTAPLAAIGQAGLGRVSVLTAEADGKYTGKFAQDPDAGTLLAALANWVLAPDDGNRDFLLTQDQKNGAHFVELSLDPAREKDPFTGRPEVTTLIVKDGKTRTRKDPMEWVAPDRLAVGIPLENGAVSLSTVSWEGIRPQPLAPAALTCSPEFLPEEITGTDRLDLTELSALSGGRERFMPEKIWEEIPPRKRLTDLTPYLIFLAMLLLLLEVAERRFGIFSVFKRKKQNRTAEKSAVREKRKKRKPVKRSSLPKQEHSPEKESPAQDESPADSLSEALRKARGKR